jgi:hypothetical protein
MTARSFHPLAEPLDGRLLLSGVPTLMINDATVIEGNAGITYAAVGVHLTSPSKQTVTVDYSTANGTAVAGSDYQATSGKLSFAPGQTSQTVLVPVIGDRIGEFNETFSVKLSGARNANVGASSSGYVTILDDDPHLTIRSAWAYEWDGQMTFIVELSTPFATAVTVDFATRDGSAVAGQDYEATAGTLTFAPGETTKTFTVAIYADSVPEPTEDFAVVLSNASVNDLIVGGTSGGSIYDQPDPVWGDPFGP